MILTNSADYLSNNLADWLSRFAGIPEPPDGRPL